MIDIFPIIALLLVIYTAYEVHSLARSVQCAHRIHYKDALQITLREIAVRVSEMLVGGNRWR